jgi:hypothetical protein
MAVLCGSRVSAWAARGGTYYRRSSMHPEQAMHMILELRRIADALEYISDAIVEAQDEDEADLSE